MSVDVTTEAEPRGGLPGRVSAPLARLRPRLSLSETILLVWRGKWLICLVFLPIMLLGVGVTVLVPATYAASARLLVRPVAWQADDRLGQRGAHGEGIGHDAVRPSDLELARSPVLIERVIEEVGLSRLYPGFARGKLRSTEGGVHPLSREAIDRFDRDLDVIMEPNSAVMQLRYVHDDPALAAQTLNRFVEAYLSYRTQVILGAGSEGIVGKRITLEHRLAAADDALRAFMVRNALLDFETETADARARFSAVSDARAEVEASRREAEARAAALSKQMALLPRKIDLYSETDLGAEMNRLLLRRAQLQAENPADKAALEAVTSRISHVDSLMKSSPADAVVRSGPNPSWQALEVERAGVAASIAALASRASALDEQKRALEARISLLAGLAPEYLRLKRDRDALEAAAAFLAAQAAGEQAERQPQADIANSMMVLEYAQPLALDTMSRQIILAITAIGGLVVALVVGLVRARSTRSFPTARALERTLGIPVLAAAPEQGA